MAQQVLLHVVYAGRGDALVLEYAVAGQRELVCIDGGPMTYSFVNPAQAPFWKYYLATLQSRWDVIRPAVPPNPQALLRPHAVIISHEDNDHYGGILHMFETSWRRSFDFDGPFVMRAVRKKYSTVWDDVKHMFNTPLRGAVPLYEKRHFPVAGLTCWYPFDPQVASYATANPNDPTISAPPEKPDKEINSESLLLQTELPGNAPSSIVLTGDTNARQVVDWVIGPPAPIPRYSVYKIQHHGSKFDSAFNKPVTSVAQAVRDELTVRLILRWGQLLPFNALDDADKWSDFYNAAFPNRPQWIYERLLHHLGWWPLNAANTALLLAFIAQLDVRQAQFKAWVLTNPNGYCGLAAAVGPYTPALTAAQLLALVRAEIETLRPGDAMFPAFYDTTIPPNVLVQSKLEWTKRFIGRDFFCRGTESLAMVTSIQAFYARFDANAYVISADWTSYEHPSPALLAGLIKALSVKVLPAGYPQPVIFLTTGETLNNFKFQFICNEIGLANPLAHTEIRVLARGRYMTIDGQDGPLAIANRDVNHSTSVVNAALMPGLTAIRASFDLDSARIDWASLRDFGQENWRIHVINFNNNPLGAVNNMYLSFQPLPAANPRAFLPIFQQGAPGLANQFRVCEAWMLAHPNNDYIRISQGNFSLELQVLQSIAAGPGHPNQYRFKLAFNDGLSIRPGVALAPTVQTFAYTARNPNPPNIAAAPFPAPVVPFLDEVWVEFVPIIRPFAAMNVGAALGEATPYVKVFAENVTPQTEPLADYFNALNITAPPSMTVEQAAVALTSQDEVDRLALTRPFEKSILSAPVDLQTSKVSVTDAVVDSATLMAEPPASATPVTIDADVMPLTAGSVDLTLAQGEISKAQVTASLGEAAVSLQTAHNNNRHSGDIRGMNALFTAMNIHKSATGDYSDLTIMEILGILLRNRDRAFDLLTEGIPAFLVRLGLPSLKPDFNKSEVTALHMPARAVAISSAEIVLDTASSPSWLTAVASVLTIGDVQLHIDQPVLNLANLGCNSTAEQLSLTVSATFSDPASSQLSLSLIADFQLNMAPKFTFEVGGTSQIGDLMNALPGKHDVSALEVPLTKDHAVAAKKSAISAVNTTALSFTMTQHMIGADSYDVVSVAAKASLSDWRSYLPASFPQAVADISGWFRVDYPFNTATRCVSAGVAMVVQATPTVPSRWHRPTMEPVSVRIAFDAMALAPEQYHYEVLIQQPAEGLSLGDITRSVGNSDVVGHDLAGGFPLVSELLDSLVVEQLKISVNRNGSNWAFGDWSLKVRLVQLNIITDKLLLENLSLEVTRTEKTYDCELSAVIGFGAAPQRSINVAGALPSAKRLGFLRFENTDRISVREILSYYSLDDQSKEPVLPEVIQRQSDGLASDSLDLTLESASITIRRKPAATAGASDTYDVVGAGFKLAINNLKIGPLDMSTLAFEFEYASADSSSSEPPFVAFNLQAYFSTHSVMAEVIYESNDGLIKGSLRPISDSHVYVLDVIRKLLPHVTNLDDLLHNLEFKSLDLVLKTERSHDLVSFSAKLASDSQIAVEKLTLTHLEVSYTAATPVVGTTPAVPSKYSIIGRVAKGTSLAQLSLTCDADDLQVAVTCTVEAVKDHPLSIRTFLTSLFDFGMPANDKTPDGTTSNPFDVNLEIVTGTIVKQTDATTKKTSVHLSKFLASASSVNQLHILDDPAVKLDLVKVLVDYDATRTTNKVIGVFQCHLTVGAADLWLYYLKAPDGTETFATQADLHLTSKNGPSASVNLDTMSDSVSIAHHPIPFQIKNLPPGFAMVKLGGKMVRNKSVELWGEGIATWDDEVANLKLKTTALGAYINIQKSAVDPNSGVRPSSNVYVFVTGLAELANFKSNQGGSLVARATLELSRGAQSKSLFSGLVYPAPGDSDVNLQSLSHQVDPTKDWQTLIPSNTFNLVFDHGGLYFNANFSAATGPFSPVLVYGKMPAIGEALFISKTVAAVAPSTTPSRLYFVTINVTADIGTVWPDFTQSVGASFTLDALSIQVSNHNTTVKQLTDDITTGTTLPTDNTIEDDSKNLNAIATLISNTNAATKGVADGTSIQAGFQIFAAISLKADDNSMSNKNMNKALASGSEPATRPNASATLYAVVPSTPSQAQFHVEIKNLVLRGGALVLHGTADYKQATSTFNGSLTVNINEVVSTALVFTADVLVSPAQTTAQLTVCRDPPTVTEPLGMFNVAFVSLTGTVDITPTTNIVALSGKARIGAASTLQGSLIFASGKPVIGLVEWSTNVDIVKVFDDLIQKATDTNKAQWPNNYETFTLTDVWVSYSRLTTDYTHKWPNVYTNVAEDRIRPGYNLTARLKLFDELFEININVPLARNGVIITGTYYGQVDFGWGRVIGYKNLAVTNATDEGMGLSINTVTSSTSFEAKCGFEFFDVHKCYAKFSATPKAGVISATLTYEGDVSFLDVKNPSIEIEYHTEGSQIVVKNFTGLPKFARDAIAIEDAISAGSKVDKNSSCGEIIDFLFENATWTRWDFEFLGLKGTAGSDGGAGGFVVNIKCTYTVYLGIKPLEETSIPVNSALATAEIKDIPFTFKPPYTQDGALNTILKFLKDHLTEIGAALFEKPDQMANLCALAVVPLAAKQVLNRLLCRGIKDAEGKMQERGRQEARQETRNARNQGRTASNSSNGITGGGGGGGGGGAVIAGGAAGAGSMEGVATVFAIAFGAFVGIKLFVDMMGTNDDIRTHNNDPMSDQEKQDLIDEMNQAQKDVDAAREFIRNLLNLSGPPVLTWVGAAAANNSPDDHVHVDWSTVLPNGNAGDGKPMDYQNFDKFEWHVTANITGVEDDVSTAACAMTAVTHNAVFSTTLQHTAWDAADQVYVWVRARYPPHTDSAEWFVALRAEMASIAHRPHLPQYTGTKATLSPDSIDLEMQPPLQHWLQYTLTANGPQSQSSNYAQQMVWGETTPSKVSIPLRLCPQWATSVTVSTQVTAVPPESAKLPPPVQVAQFTCLSAPVIKTVSKRYDSRGIAVTITIPVGGYPNGFRIDIRSSYEYDSYGNTIVPGAHPAGDASGAVTVFLPIQTDVNVHVGAVGNDHEFGLVASKMWTWLAPVMPPPFDTPQRAIRSDYTFYEPTTQTLSVGTQQFLGAGGGQLNLAVVAATGAITYLEPKTAFAQYTDYARHTAVYCWTKDFSSEPHLQAMFALKDDIGYFSYGWSQRFDVPKRQWPTQFNQAAVVYLADPTTQDVAPCLAIPQTTTQHSVHWKITSLDSQGNQSSSVENNVVVQPAPTGANLSTFELIPLPTLSNSTADSMTALITQPADRGVVMASSTKVLKSTSHWPRSGTLLDASQRVIAAGSGISCVDVHSDTDTTTPGPRWCVTWCSINDLILTQVPLATGSDPWQMTFEIISFYGAKNGAALWFLFRSCRMLIGMEGDGLDLFPSDPNDMYQPNRDFSLPEKFAMKSGGSVVPGSATGGITVYWVGESRRIFCSRITGNSTRDYNIQSDPLSFMSDVNLRVAVNGDTSTQITWVETYPTWQNVFWITQDGSILWAYQKGQNASGTWTVRRVTDDVSTADVTNNTGTTAAFRVSDPMHESGRLSFLRPSTNGGVTAVVNNHSLVLFWPTAEGGLASAMCPLVRDRDPATFSPTTDLFPSGGWVFNSIAIPGLADPQTIVCAVSKGPDHPGLGVFWYSPARTTTITNNNTTTTVTHRRLMAANLNTDVKADWSNALWTVQQLVPADLVRGEGLPNSLTAATDRAKTRIAVLYPGTDNLVRHVDMPW